MLAVWQPFAASSLPAYLGLFPYLCPMPTARIIDTTTGDVQLRQFETAAQARRELARELGRRLVWEREETEWVAVDDEVEYRVEVSSS